MGIPHMAPCGFCVLGILFQCIQVYAISMQYMKMHILNGILAWEKCRKLWMGIQK